MSTTKRNAIHYEAGSGNVYADLGLKDADWCLVRAQVVFHVSQILGARRLNQTQIAARLGIAQRDVAHLMNGHFSRFSTDKLQVNPRSLSTSDGCSVISRLAYRRMEATN